MMTMQAISLPMPRVVVGQKVRARTDANLSYALVEEASFLVRSVSAAEAPLAVVERHMPLGDAWRSFDGALYRPLFGKPTGPVTPQEVGMTLLCRAHYATDNEWKPKGPMPSSTTDGETLVDIERTFKNLPKEVGLLGMGEARMRSVSDEGMAAANALRDGIAENILLVDGLAWHRCPAPYVRIELTNAIGENRLVLGPIETYPFLNPIRNLAFPAPAWLRFPLDRVEEAREMARELSDRGWMGSTGVTDYPDMFEVVDADALSAGCPGDGLETLVRDCARDIQRLTGPVIHLLGDEPIHALSALRGELARMAAEGPADAAQALLGYGVATLADPDGQIPRLVEAMEALRVRYEGFEAPRAGIAMIDEDDMSALEGFHP